MQRENNEKSIKMTRKVDWACVITLIASKSVINIRINDKMVFPSSYPMRVFLVSMKRSIELSELNLQWHTHTWRWKAIDHVNETKIDSWLMFGLFCAVHFWDEYQMKLRELWKVSELKRSLKKTLIVWKSFFKLTKKLCFEMKNSGDFRGRKWKNFYFFLIRLILYVLFVFNGLGNVILSLGEFGNKKKRPHLT